MTKSVEQNHYDLTRLSTDSDYIVPVLRNNVDMLFLLADFFIKRWEVRTREDMPAKMPLVRLQKITIVKDALFIAIAK